MQSSDLIMAYEFLIYLYLVKAHCIVHWVVCKKVLRRWFTLIPVSRIFRGL
jgi:hypothetical protein